MKIVLLLPSVTSKKSNTKIQMKQKKTMILVLKKPIGSKVMKPINSSKQQPNQSNINKAIMIIFLLIQI